MTVVGKSDVQPSGRRFVLMALANFADEEWSCFPTVTQISAWTGQADKTVRDHLDDLEREGIITRERTRRDDGTLGRYRFAINRRKIPVEDHRQISPPADFARGEKGQNPPADFAALEPSTKPSSISSPSARGEFDQFWLIYPNKVGKRAAESAFATARKRVSQPDLIAGLLRYIAKTDDRPWCNPSTWLNQDRWTDEPAAPTARAGPFARPINPTLQAALNLQDKLNAVSPNEIAGHHQAPRLVAIGGSSG